MLRPDRELVWLVKYLLAVCAKRHGIELHEVALMSSHLHMLFTDWLGRRGLFFNDFHAMLARCVQRLRGWKLPVFDKRQTNQPVAACPVREMLRRYSSPPLKLETPASCKYPPTWM